VEFADKQERVAPGFYFGFIDYYVNLRHDMFLGGLGEVEAVCQ
jgi:hypothetical protein